MKMMIGFHKWIKADKIIPQLREENPDIEIHILPCDECKEESLK